jgi:hypothetical protein
VALHQVAVEMGFCCGFRDLAMGEYNFSDYSKLAQKYRFFLAIHVLGDESSTFLEGGVCRRGWPRAVCEDFI